jgi:DMSO/TMAO reductase YedYZ heme-binding membrane subunit
MMLLWYASRSAGLLAQILLSATMVLGITGVMRITAAGWPRFVLTHLHRNLSLLTLVFLAVHISTAVIDPYVSIRWIDAVVPFTSSYETFWLGLGAVALELLITLIATSLLRPRIGLATWRGLHWAAYACWPIAVIHGLGIGGQDTRTPWIVALTGACVAVVLGALAWRLLAAPGKHPEPAGATRQVEVTRR